MSLEARNWARRIGGLSIAAKAVLMALADHANAEGKAWPKLKTLGEATSMTERHVRRQIGVLEERGAPSWPVTPVIKAVFATRLPPGLKRARQFEARRCLLQASPEWENF